MAYVLSVWISFMACKARPHMTSEAEMWQNMKDEKVV
jgi:hypothetical protein